MSKRSKPLRAALAALRGIYSSMPTIECKKLCGHYCGPIMMSDFELERMEEAHGGPFPILSPVVGNEMSCPLLRAGQCSIYESRPAICRLFGLVEKLRCPHGCQPSRFLTDREAQQMLRRIEEISERYFRSLGK